MAKDERAMTFSEAAREFWVRTRPLFKTSHWAYWACVAIFGGLPWLSVFKRLIEHFTRYKVDLSWVPKTLLSGYEFARDAFIARTLKLIHLLTELLPVDLARWIRQVFDYVFSSSLLDFLTIWVLIAFGVYRGSLKNRTNDRQRLRADPEQFRNDLRDAATVNGLDAEDLVRRVESGLAYGLTPNLYFAYRALRSCLRLPVVLHRNVNQVRKKSGADHARILFWEWGLSVFYALFGAFIYLISSGLRVDNA